MNIELLKNKLMDINKELEQPIKKTFKMDGIPDYMYYIIEQTEKKYGDVVAFGGSISLLLNFCNISSFLFIT